MVKSTAASRSKKEIEVSSKPSRPLRPVKDLESKPSRPVNRLIFAKTPQREEFVEKPLPPEEKDMERREAEVVSPPSLPDGVLKAYDALRYPSAHSKAFTDVNGRAIRATTELGFLVFGQYEKNFPVQDLTAVFSIMVDNNTFDDAYVCALDVVQDKSRVIAKSVLTRKDFPEAKKHVRFAIPFKPSSTDSLLEFRLFYMGHTYMAIRGIYVLDPAILSAENLPPDSELLPPIPLPSVGNYVYDLKATGTSLYNGTQKLTITGWSTYMWKDMKTYPWDGPYKGKTPGEYADILVRYNANLTRTFCIDTWTSSIFPWKKIGNKFDLNQFDPTYLNSLKDLVTAFGSRGILVQLALFDNVALWDHGDGMTWTRHPFNAANGGPIRDPKDGRREFYNPDPTVKALQEKYLRYMVSSLKDLKNIIFEVCNEYNGGGGTSWHNWVADVIKSENPEVLVVGNTDVHVSVSDQIFRYKNINITSSHSGEWISRDFRTLHQDILNRLKGYGKPTLLSTDGSQENWAAQKNDMIKAANAVIPQGFGLEFKELIESVAQGVAPLGVRIEPSKQVPGTDFCKGGEFVCIDGFDQQKIEKMGGKVWGGQFANGAFTPGNKGGIEFNFVLDTNKSYAVEFEIQNNIANMDKDEADGGKVTLFGLETPNFSTNKPETYYGLNLQRMDKSYRPQRGLFRSILTLRYDEEKYGLLITDNLSGFYSHQNWGSEPHRFRIEVRRDKYQLFIDNNYISKESTAPGPFTPGSRNLRLMIGGTVERKDKQHAITQFTKFKVYYI